MRLRLPQIVPTALVAALAWAAPASAETDAAPTRQLEPIWQTAVPGLGKLEERVTLRLRVQDDNRVSFAVHNVLVTLDSAGKLLSRVALPVRPNEDYASVPLQGGDFLVQANSAGFGEMRIARYTASGSPRFAHADKLHRETNSILLDAVLLPDGRVAAAVSLGPGPNDIMALFVFDAAGRRVADHRMVIFSLTSDRMTRLFARIRAGELESVSVFGIGTRPSGSETFVKAFGFMGQVPVAHETQFLGPVQVKCSAMSSEGDAVLGVTDVKRGDERVTLRWYDDAREQKETRDLGEAAACQITLRRDGSSLVWLAPRKLFAFDADAKLLWRAELAVDALAIGWMSDGDIVAVHAAASGTNVVRYLAR